MYAIIFKVALENKIIGKYIVYLCIRRIWYSTVCLSIELIKANRFLPNLLGKLFLSKERIKVIRLVQYPITFWIFTP